MRLILAILLGLVLPHTVRAADVTVFAAASLRGALDRVVETWQSETGAQVAVSYAGSATLARQIQNGAPADLFLSANSAWMDVLEAAGALQPDSRMDLLGNTLVLVAHGAGGDTDLDARAVLGAKPAAARIAMGLTGSVPAGIYGKQALISLGLWDALAGDVVESDNVRAAMALVAQGEAPFGILYGSDARAAHDAQLALHVVAQFAPQTHDPITYPAALTARATPLASALLSALTTDTAGRIFTEAGFTPLRGAP
ncbi:Molybdate-binding periplasmic protein precursor [Aquimixticola soesokkakensis]|uniref:Molybdate-binding protein ModA n=1 Tax=Aquimixticola soesokkakensis TaxID=1519096 RepID=A0A1Y5RV64_9RHOB|nr:molybdate ABC transporter substrate-binding protein [Aquimixticola soesokkakensis]SLN23361.1 Molybdate-binding periplasmic protein precursor [Aquimixticola soesokkakensis]